MPKCAGKKEDGTPCDKMFITGDMWSHCPVCHRNYCHIHSEGGLFTSGCCSRDGNDLIPYNEVAERCTCRLKENRSPFGF